MCVLPKNRKLKAEVINKSLSKPQFFLWKQGCKHNFQYMLYSFNAFAAAAAARGGLIRLQSTVTAWELPTPLHCQLTIDPGWDKPGDLDTSAGSDETALCPWKPG